MFGSGGSMSAETMKNVSRSADELVASAKSGGFRVTKEAADPIIETLEEFITKVGVLKAQMVSFDHAPPLGDHDYGKRVARHMWEAANDERSARAALESLDKILTQSRDALRIASKQYQEQEESALGSFRGLGD
nr:hypothetical protein [Saccharomonospora piscinae]